MAISHALLNGGMLMAISHAPMNSPDSRPGAAHSAGSLDYFPAVSGSGAGNDPHSVAVLEVTSFDGAQCGGLSVDSACCTMTGDGFSNDSWADLSLVGWLLAAVNHHSAVLDQDAQGMRHFRDCDGGGAHSTVFDQEMQSPRIHADRILLNKCDLVNEATL